MAQFSFEYKILTGRENEELASQLGSLSNCGWRVAQMTSLRDDIVILLQREKDYEVAQSLQQALEERIEEPPAIITDAIGKEY